MSGRLIGMILIACGVIAGGALYYLQVYAFYQPVTLAPEGPVEMQISVAGVAQPLAVQGFSAIDATSSPIRFRACFIAEIPEGADPYPQGAPLTAPGWFDCFDADAIGTALRSGAARTYLGQANVTYGIDRVIAVFPGGQAFAWHQINACGEEVFDGRPAPEGCPPVEGRN